MLHLTSVRFQNLSTYGNELHEVVLDKTKTTLIIGKNGTGKSSGLLDSICLCLYNTPYRKVSKAKLINSHLKKLCLTEVDLVEGKDKYTVRRGMKPNIFEIWKNGELMPQEDAGDYQAMLERDILKMNFKTFKQIVLLGSKYSVPFMELTAAGRREVVEDILDLTVISKMNVVLKERMKRLKAEIMENEKATEVAWAVLEREQAHAAAAAEDNTKEIEDAQARLDNLASLVKVHDKAIEKIIKDRDANQEELDRVRVIWCELELLGRRIESLGVKIADVDKERKDIEHMSICPSCRRNVSEEWRNTISEDIEKRLVRLVADRRKLIDEVSEKTPQTLKMGDLTKMVEFYKQSLYERRSERNELVATARQLHEKIKRLSAPIESTVSLKEAQEKVSFHSAVKDEHLKVGNLMAQAAALLKDDGIKAKIISTYIPMFNELISHYMEQLGLFVTFELNEEFEEVIRSRGCDDFSYHNFSGGERLRIDLAILFAWREITRRRNNASVNLLVFDETLDASMDADGAHDFVKMLSNVTSDVNTFVVSHLHGETYSELFDRTIRAEKKFNFSRLKEL